MPDAPESKDKVEEKAPAPARADDRISAVRPMLGVVVGLIPFAAHYNQTRSQTVTETEIRTVVRRTPFDMVAVPCGLFALVIGVFGFVKGLKARRLVVGFAGIASASLGVIQVVRGYWP